MRPRYIGEAEWYRVYTYLEVDAFALEYVNTRVQRRLSFCTDITLKKHIDMKITVKPELLDKFPNYREGILVVKNIDNTKGKDGSYQHLMVQQKEMRQEGIVENSKWVEGFRNLGLDTTQIKPSHIALQERVYSAKDLPSLSTVVNVINGVQLFKDIPVGAHDIDKIEGDVEVGPNIKGLSFNDRTGGNTKVTTDEFVHADTKEVLTRNWVWRQGTKDLCDENTQNIILFINSLNTEDSIEEIAKDIATRIEFFTESKVDCSLEVLSADNTEVDTDNMPQFTDRGQFNFDIVPIYKDKEIIERILDKAVEEILPSKKALEEMLYSGRRIRIYQGFDPTADTLHIGHTVMMRKLEDFRKLGHEVIFLIGDFTGRIGDPSDKSSTRKQLTPQQVEENLKLYKEQASALIDVENKDNPVQVLYNNDWLGKLTFGDVVELASEFTVQQMIKRSMFKDRLENDKPIGLHEFMYPLMQGYDSVAMDVDIEVGGNDQLFNMMAGRTLCKSMLRQDKLVIAGKLLATADGKKMGKSEGNMIKLSDSAVDIYGKVMAFPDGHIVPGFELLTAAGMDEVEAISSRLDSSENPMVLKKELALRLTSELKGESDALAAQEHFENVFQNDDVGGADLEVFEVSSSDVLDVIVEVGFAGSKSEARRLVEQGAVSLDVEKVRDWSDVLGSGVLKVGKRVIEIKT